MPVAKVNGSRLFAPLLAGGAVGQVPTTGINHLTLFLFRHLTEECEFGLYKVLQDVDGGLGVISSHRPPPQKYI